MKSKPTSVRFPLLALALAITSQAGAQQVIFSEVMYNPPGDLPEYIEVLNNTATPYDIATWELRGGVNYTFPKFNSSNPEWTFLKAFERILISPVTEEVLREAYPAIPAAVRIYGPWDGLDEAGNRTAGNLANGGERITLKTKNDTLVCTFSYDDDPAFWPVAADGAGHSLQVINRNRGIDDWRNWRPSTHRGGSPGSPDAEPEPSSLSLSEIFFDETGNLAWIEVHNVGTVTAELGDLKLAVPGTVINNAGEPAAAANEAALVGQLGPGAYLSVDVDFEIENDNVKVLLVDGSGNVISAHKIENPDAGTAYQMFPPASGEWYASSVASRDSANDPDRHDMVIINEIMYDHPAGNIAEFIELYNKGESAVDLSGWEITAGVGFEFPNGTIIAPQSYVVIAADAGWCQENYENVDNPLGGFAGGLSNDGETIRIVDARGNLVDQVTYGAGGEWPEFANGLGSSLELVHPDVDNNRGSAWRDSDESQKSELREYSASMRYDGSGIWHPTNDDELHLHLVGEAYILLEDINFSKPKSLFNPDSKNLLLNADQESTNSRSNTGWVFQGTHAFGFYQDGEVHLKATGRGDNRANRVEIDTDGLGSSADIQLTFQARWIYGNPRMIAQTSDHGWSSEFLIDIPTNLGTPGTANSAATETAPPQIDDLHHAPAVPKKNDDVTVSARVSAAGGLESVQLAYIDDSPGGNDESLFRRWKRVPMQDNGSDGDATAGDGTYSGKITDMKIDGRIVAFYVEATSQSGEHFEFPQGGSARPALYVVDDQTPDFELRTVRAVVGQKDLDAIADGSGSKHEGKFPRSSNHYWNATVIYDESEIFYNAVIRSAGSPFHTGERANLGLKGKWKMPKSNAWRGRIKTTYDQDPTSGRAHNDRVIRYWLYLLGHKVNDNEFIKLAVNDGSWATREEVETPGSSDFMNRLWENGNQGHMYRVDDEWDFGDNLNDQRNSRNAEWNYKSPNGHRAGRYHSEYMLRSRETEYDFTALIDGFRLLSNPNYTQEEAARYFDIEMIALNAAARGYIHDWDFQTLNRGKNTFLYQRPDGLIQYVHWDSDLAFRTGDLNAAFATGQGSALRNFLQKPWLQRWFKFYLHELSEKYADGSPRFETWLELEDNSTRDQGCDINRYISWGRGRRSAVNRELGNATSAPFAITTNDGQNFATTDDIITLQGTSPIDAYEVFIEDHPEAEINWTGTTEYELRGVVLREGENNLSVRARDSDGGLLGSLFSPKNESITITKTNPSKPIPVLAFEPGSLNVSLGQRLEIDAGESWDPEGDILTVSFAAPSGSAIAVDGSTAKLTFDQPGIYPLTITIADPEGNVTEVIREVSVYGGLQGFENFSERRISAYWQKENIAEKTTSFRSNSYVLGDPEGMLAFELAPDAAKPLSVGGSSPSLLRELPAEKDFSLQTKVILANLQLGPFHTGVIAEILVEDEPRRFAFGIKNGNALTVSEVQGNTVTDLASVEHNAGRSTLRIRRVSGELHFDYRDSDQWHSVHTLALPANSTATRGGLFVATEEALSMRVVFDYAMLIDTDQVSDMQRDLRLTEIMYHPAEGEEFEFLEMQNIGNATLDLTGSHFTDGIEYTFDGVQLGAGQFLILAKDPVAFAQAYDARGAQVAGGYNGRLSNGGETLEFLDPEKRLIFSFTYSDAGLWPAEADGQGASLEVIDARAGVNDPANWRVSAAVKGSPGTGGETVAPDPEDSDGDGLPDAWEQAFGLNANDATDSMADLDDDGWSNLEEHLANTNPADGRSFLSLLVTRAVDSVRLDFAQQPERRYTVEFTDDLDSGQWQALEVVEPSEVTVPVSSIDAAMSASAVRFYRLRVSLP